MSNNDVAVRAVPSVQTNGFAIAAFVLSLLGMYASPIVRGQQGFGLAMAALAVSAAVTALHVAMWIRCGHPNFELLATAHW
jgi:hypothetical protein